MEKPHLSITVAMLFVFALAAVTPAHAAEPIDVGSRKQLFIDDGCPGPPILARA